MNQPKTKIIKPIYRLRDLRKEKGYTQEDIARKVGIPLRSYQRIEWNEYQNKPEHDTKISTAVKIAKVLGVTVYDVLEWSKAWHEGLIGINPNDPNDKNIYALEYEDPEEGRKYEEKVGQLIFQSIQKKED